MQHGADLSLGGFDLGVECAGGDAQRPVTEDDDLLGAVGRRDAHAAFAAQLVGRALDVGVGSLSLLGVDDLDAVHRPHAAGVALDLIGVEHDDDAALAKALIVGENVDQRAARRGERHAHFNKLLLDRIGETLARGGQAMLFQNRRGFSPYVECTECGWTARCPHCNVTLTYHKGGARLVCHYCGYTAPVPAKCPSCEVTEVLPRGFGTEKVEEEIARLFPEARVARLDRDSVTSERAFNAIISDFEARKTDILVGTQMITKGFDFGGVSLVGILNADNLLNNPDFRAAERAFQLMLQVAGRAGRRSDGGEVVIQTSEPGHPVIRQVVAGDFAGMARMQLSEREAFFYPPYARLTSLTLRHRDVALLRRGVTELAARLRVRFGRRVLGPMTPPVDRIRGEYLAGLLLKIESGASSAKARSLLAAELKAFAENPEFKTITVVCNVDPQ